MAENLFDLFRKINDSSMDDDVKDFLKFFLQNKVEEKSISNVEKFIEEMTPNEDA